MRKIRCCFTILLLLLALTACQGQQATETNRTPMEIAEAILESQSGLPTLTPLTAEEDYFANYLTDYYQLDNDHVEDGVIYYADGVEGTELAVLLLKDESAAKTAESQLSQYLKNRTNDFGGYAPQQAELVENGGIAVHGRYIALLICQNTESAQSAFLGCFGDAAPSLPKASSAALSVASPNSDTSKPIQTTDTASSAISSDVDTSEPVQSADVASTASSPSAEAAGNPAETEYVASSSAGNGGQPAAAPPAPKEDAYNAAAVVFAWQTGDDSSLTEMNRSILNAARDVIAKEISDDMSDYEKELAIHDWMTSWSSFDMNVFSHAPTARAEADNRNPYGFFINRSAMCHGYSSTFQLFMDLLDIECITVFGIPSGNGVEHSWNMVRLDGEWYCVDTAWDDPIGGTPNHSYFNVTSQYMRDGGIHRWDTSSVPEATGTAYAYGN